MKNTENESDKSTKTTAIKEDVKSTPEKSCKSVKNKPSALLQDVDEEIHNNVSSKAIDFKGITKIVDPESKKICFFWPSNDNS